MTALLIHISNFIALLFGLIFHALSLTTSLPTQAAFISSYMHSVIIFAVIAALIFTVFAPSNPNADQLGSIHQVYQNLLIRAQVRWLLLGIPCSFNVVRIWMPFWL